MEDATALLRGVFEKLNARVGVLNRERKAEGGRLLPRAEVKLLGQMSLLANERVSAVLALAQTGDLDAILDMEYVVKKEFEALLKANGLVYDEDSTLIWIPAGATFGELFDLENVRVRVIDPESALVSKAVKAPEKNVRLIEDAIASGEFPGLVDRIVEQGGDLEFFARKRR